jgi:hypothetical protein
MGVRSHLVESTAFACAVWLATLSLRRQMRRAAHAIKELLQSNETWLGIDTTSS